MHALISARTAGLKRDFVPTDLVRGDLVRSDLVRKAPVARSAVLAAFTLIVAAGLAPVAAQTGAPDQSKQAASVTPSDSAKDTQREFNEAAQAINGPAGNPECVWLGRRAVQLMLRDDLDTAFRHLDLYDRFGCPGGHIQATFRCVARFGIPDIKAAEAIRVQVHTCWVNPAAQPPQPQPAAAPANGAATPAPQAPPANGQPQPPAK